MKKLNPIDQTMVDTINAMPLAEHDLALPSSAKVETFKRIASYVGNPELANSILNRTRKADVSDNGFEWAIELTLGSRHLSTGEMVLQFSSEDGHLFNLTSGRVDDADLVLGLRA